MRKHLPGAALPPPILGIFIQAFQFGERWHGGPPLRIGNVDGVASSYQQLEVPLVTARRVQHEARCGCGEVHVTARPTGLPATAVSIGPNLRALAVYQHVPVQRCAELIAALTGAGVSAGFIHSCLARTAAVIADVVRLIKTLITTAASPGTSSSTKTSSSSAPPARRQLQ